MSSGVGDGVDPRRCGEVLAELAARLSGGAHGERELPCPLLCEPIRGLAGPIKATEGHVEGPVHIEDLGRLAARLWDGRPSLGGLDEVAREASAEAR